MFFEGRPMELSSELIDMAWGQLLWTAHSFECPICRMSKSFAAA